MDECLRLSLALSSVLPVPCFGYMSNSMAPAQGLRLFLVPYPSSFRMGFVPPSEAPLSAVQLPALPFLVVLIEAAGLRGSGIHPLFFPASGYASMPTCFALAPVRRLSLVLGPISFWMGFAPYLRILFAPCGCRRTYCGPHCARESERVLASILGSSPSWVSHRFRVCYSVGAQSESLTRSIPRSFLVESLSASAVGLADAL